MSEPQDLTCRETADKLYEFIDGELTAGMQESVRIHLADCLPCMSRHNFETAFLKFVHARTRARSAPQHLKRQVFELLLCEEDQPGSN